MLSSRSFRISPFMPRTVVHSEFLSVYRGDWVSKCSFSYRYPLFLHYLLKSWFLLHQRSTCYDILTEVPSRDLCLSSRLSSAPLLNAPPACLENSSQFRRKLDTVPDPQPPNHITTHNYKKQKCPESIAIDVWYPGTHGYSAYISHHNYHSRQLQSLLSVSTWAVGRAGAHSGHTVRYQAANTCL